MISKKIELLIGSILLFLKENARILTKIFAFIGLIFCGVWLIAHFWTAIKLILALFILGLCCGGWRK